MPRRWLVVVPGVISLLLGLRLSQPSVFPDEIGAILNARHVVGIGPASPWWYLPGYGLFLAPIILFTDDPAHVVRSVQIVNASLMITSALGLVASLRLLVPNATEEHRWQAGVLALLMPGYLYFASFAIADNAMIAMAAWLAPVTERLRRSSSWITLVVSFAGSGVAASMHSRAVILPVAVSVGLLADSRRRSMFVRAVVLLIGAAVGRAVAAAALDRDGGSVLSGTGRQSLGSLLSDNATVEGVATLPATILGQLFAVTIASLGLVVLGMSVAQQSKLLRGSHSPAFAAVMACVLGSLLMSALFTNGGSGDYALYARYVEVSVPVIVALGWLGLLQRSVRPSPLLPVAVVASGVALVAFRGFETFDGRIQRLNVAGLSPYLWLGDGLQPIWLGLLGGTALVAFAGLLRVRSSLGVTFALVVFGVAAVDNVEASRSFIDNAGGPPVIGQIINLSDADCVALDQAGLEDFWFQENLRLHHLDIDVSFWPTDVPTPPCDDLVVSSRPDLGVLLPGWLPVAVEPARAQWLWASSQFRERHSLEPLVGANVGSVLIDPAGSIDLTVVAASDQEMVVQLTVLNAGQDVFVPASNLVGGAGGVQIGLEWRSTDEPLERRMEPIRVGLPGLLGPGESVTVSATLPREDRTGDVVLHAELVQEGVGWIDSISASMPVRGTS